MNDHESGAQSGPSPEAAIRTAVASGIRVPAGLIGQGVTAFSRYAVKRVDDLSRELDLKAVELRTRGLSGELTEEAVEEALRRLAVADSQAVLRAAGERTALEREQERQARRRRDRTRRRLAVALSTTATAGIAAAPTFGPWTVFAAILSLTLVAASAAMTLLGGE